jgi:hypothetical protein
MKFEGSLDAMAGGAKSIFSEVLVLGVELWPLDALGPFRPLSRIRVG